MPAASKWSTLPFTDPDDLGSRVPVSPLPVSPMLSGRLTPNSLSS